ncbi:MAG: hypothetical protein OXE96_08675 [Gemmatimonadetes bacterium]|nr:hypothetical protein [Gemmatimonadota bacterium]
MTRGLRPTLIGITGASVLAAAGCASRSAPVPDIVTLHAYNGEWVLEAGERAPVGMQFISQDGYGFTSEAAGKIVGAMAIRTERFRLEVSDSIFRISSDQQGSSFALPIDGTAIEVPGQDGEVQSLTLTWDRGAPVVQRAIPGVGRVSERFELTGDGALVLTRTGALRNSGGRVVEAVGMRELFYTRNHGSNP